LLHRKRYAGRGNLVEWDRFLKDFLSGVFAVICPRNPSQTAHLMRGLFLLAKMQYNININQKAAIDAGMIADVVDLCIFDFLQKFTNSPFCKRMSEGEISYFNVPYQKIVTELPIIGIKTSDGIYRRFKRLELCGLVQFHPDNAKNNMVWFCWGRSYDKMFFTPGQSSEGTDKEPTNPRIENRTPPDEKPTHYNTLLSYPFTINNKEKADDLKAHIEKSYTTRDSFTLSRRIAKEKFDDYLIAFCSEVHSMEKTYNNNGEIVNHFLNWSEWRSKKEEAPKPTQTPYARPASNKMRTVEVETTGYSADQLF